MSRLLASRVSILTVVPAVGIVSPLFAYPTIISTHGVGAFAALAVGQGLGGLGAVAIEMGWNLTGPQAVAGQSDVQRIRTFRASVTMKATVAAVTLPLIVVAAYTISSPFTSAVILASTAAASTGFTSSWFFIGTDRPWLLVGTEAAPKLLGVLAGCLFLLNGSALVLLPACQLVGSLLGLAVAWGIIHRDSGPSNQDAGYAYGGFSVGGWRAQGGVTLSRIVSAGYINLPVVGVQLLAPTSLPLFAAYDRLLRIGLLVAQAFPNALQAYLGQAWNSGNDVLRRRRRRVLQSQVAFGLICALFFLGGLPIALDVLFRSEVEFSAREAIACSIIALMTCSSRGLAMVHVSRRKLRAVVWSAFVAAVVFSFTAVPFIREWQAFGAFAALVVAEFCALAVQAVPLWIERRKRMSNNPSSSRGTQLLGPAPVRER